MSNKIGTCVHGRLSSPARAKPRARKAAAENASSGGLTLASSQSSRTTSRCRSVPLMFHPVEDESRAADNPEVTILAIDQEEESGAVQLLQL